MTYENELRYSLIQDVHSSLFAYYKSYIETLNNKELIDGPEFDTLG